MQSLQQKPQLLSKQVSAQFDFGDCNHQSVSDFLNHCRLSQYLDIFLSEGFDSVTSLLEITEEDMIFMNVKRGHRRLIQREIATVKGIPRDQPLITNMMGAKYPPDIMSATPNTNNNMSYNTNNPPSMNPITMNMSYNTNSLPNMHPVTMNTVSGCENVATGLTSPRSMNSGVGGSTGGSSGNNSGTGSMTTLRSRLQQQSPRATNIGFSASSSTNDSGNSSGGGIMSTNQNTGNNINNGNNSNTSQNIMSDNPHGSSISSNDDNDSIDTNESVPAKRKYRRHAKPDRHAPIKPPSAYIMFSNDSRAELKDQNLSFAELAKIVGDQWKNLSHTQKQTYERMAMRAKDEYLAALEQYQQTPQYTRYQEYLNDFKLKQDAVNRLIGRARKRAKQKSPGSGSIADASSNCNSNGSGSSGSGSADAYGDKDSVIRRQRKPSGQELLVSNNKKSSGQQKSFSDYEKESTGDKSNDKNTSSPIHLRPTHNHNHHHRHQNNNQQQSSDSGYLSQTYYNDDQPLSSSLPWSYRSNQIMRGMLPVDFVHTTPSDQQQRQNTQQPSMKKKHSLDLDHEEGQIGDDNEHERSTSYDSVKRRSPRFNKSNKTSHMQT